MTKFSLLGTSALRSTAFLGLALTMTSAAMAQEPPADPNAPVQTASQQNAQSATTAQAAAQPPLPEPGEESTEAPIVVTGSRIRRPNLDSPVPITSVTTQELLTTGNVSVGDALNDLPALRSTFSQANSTRFIGTAGLNILDLRGLGTARTLVLVNGRRHITSSPGDYLVDTNTIPTDLLERVDVITGGNSAIYGSDAVAGVVNFVLKRDFEGFRITGQGGISDEGDRGSYFASAVAGMNFADGRGNIAAAFEYAQQNPLFFTDRDNITGAFSGRRQFQLSSSTLDANGNPEPPEGNGIPDRTFQTGIRSANIADAGLFRGLLGPNGQTRNFVFDTSGQLVESICEVDFRPFGSGNCKGGLGSTLNNTGQLQPGLKRYAANLLAHFDVSDALKPFLEAKYVHIDALQEGQPSFFQGGVLGQFGIDNPFLSNQARALIIANSPPGATTFSLNRFNVDFGGRGELHDRDIYRIVGGIEGDFNDDWHYEIALNYGRLKTKLRALNNLVISNYLNAIDATRDASGQIVCAINADADPTNDDPACAPLNLFGNGVASREALNYVNTTSRRREKAEEFVASAFITGDSSQLFELPGGPVGFAIGAEYRKETAFSAWDDLVKNDETFLNAIQDFKPPAFEVKEAFGELNVPILKDMSFAQELSLSAAARVSDYKGSAGTVWAYNLGGVYAPIRAVRIRGSYSRSVRAPTQTDLFSPQSVNFDFLDDPCDVLNINSGSATRAANCAAAGIPVGFANIPARTETLRFLTGGNPDLTVEKSDSYTLGAVIIPSQILPGFTLSVDYYKIKVKNLIATVGIQNIVDTCYDAATLDNAFCELVFRQPNGFFNEDAAVLDAPVNFAAQKTSGIDVDIAYNHSFGPVRLDLRAIGSYIINRTNFLNVLDPTEPDRQKSELGDPAYEGQLSATLDFGTFDVGYKVRYIGEMVTAPDYEDQNAFNGNPPRDADAFDPSRFPEVWYHDVRLGVDVNNKFRFYGGVDNVFDRKPPLGQLGVDEGDPYDNVGRFFYLGVKADF